MNRSEFLDKLREALENDLSGPVVRENIEYYDPISKARCEMERQSRKSWICWETRG